jgi:pSer/pThr/pTyr-binding forkhead associated (FHA) protein
LSTNGTHVNGKKVSDADLVEGDIVNVGKTRFIVRLEDEDEPVEGDD